MANKAMGRVESGFSVVTRVSPTQQVREQLLTAIQSGEYPAGALLPSERRLCEAFGVSRVSIREALAGLEAMGVITVQHGRGAFVREAVGERLAPFAVYVELHRDELVDLLKIRGALDGVAAEATADRKDPQSLRRIQARHRAFVNAVKRGAKPKDLVPLDVAFHLSIAEAAGGQFLPGILKDLNGILEDSRHIIFHRDGQPEMSVEQHEAIVQAITSHDGQAANRAAVEHVKGIAAWLSTFAVDGAGESHEPVTTSAV